MVQSISPEVLELLKAYDWPGNIRELQSVIREALIASTGPTLLPEFLPTVLRRDADENERQALPQGPWTRRRGSRSSILCRAPWRPDTATSIDAHCSFSTFWC